MLTNLAKNRFSVILGDFNCPDAINFQPVYCKVTVLLLNFIQENFLYQKVKEATRNENILDLVLSTDDNLVADLSVGESLVNSDHNIIRFRLNMKTEIQSNEMRIPNFYKANFNLFRDKFSNVDWHCMDEISVNEQWELLKDKIKEVERETVPFKIKRTQMGKMKPKWFNYNICKLITDRNKVYNTYKRNKNDDNKKAYVESRRCVKKAIRNAKREYEMQIAKDSKENPKRFYDYISNRNPLRENIGPLIKNSGDLAINNQDAAKTLNEYFASVFTVEDDSEIPVPIQLRQFREDERLTSIKISEKDVVAYINKLKVTKSPGPDGIYPVVLKELNNVLAGTLVKLFNNSLKHGEVPEDFKLANITPIFKKGDKRLPSNFRPISLTSVVGKILESIIRDEIIKHLDKYSLIMDSQHGFRRNRSCLTNLLQFYNKLIEQYDDHGVVDVIYLDFSKAFDVIPHKKLMVKLKAHGIDGEVLLWIKNWLKQRKQRVVINGDVSEYITVTSGVPQGSVLGPLLFLIYVNDLDFGISNLLSKFADDTKLGGVVKNTEHGESIQNDLNKIAEWAKLWDMKFNVEKCCVLHLGRNNIRSTYNIYGKSLSATTAQKDLGVRVSEDFKFTKQCIEACEKANKVLGFIYRNFDYKSKDIILPLYKSLVRPHLEYAIQFWNPYLKKDIEMLERIQRKATKLIPSLRTLPYESRLKILGLQTLKTRRLRGDLIEVFKILNKYDNLDCMEFFALHHDERTRNNGSKLRVKRFNSSIAKNFYTYRIINDWNALPKEVVNSTSINMFKNRLDRHFKSQGVI
jgi:hypothetical protein